MIRESIDFIIKACNARLLQKQSDFFEGVSTDSRTVTAGQLFIPLVGPLFNGHDFVESAIEKGASVVMVSQGAEIPFPKESTVLFVEDTLIALQLLAKAYLLKRGPKCVAITGSTGKSSTKELVSSVLAQKYKVYKTKGNFNNHIGLPLTILDMPAETEIIVLEMGMNHYGEIRALCEIAPPDEAIITNIGDSHIEYFGSREGILKAKLEITEAFKPNNELIVNGEDGLLKSLKNADYKITAVGSGNSIFFSDYKTVSPFESSFALHMEGEEMSVQLPLIGRHNASNALLAAGVGHKYGLSLREIVTGLESATPLKMRLQVKIHEGMLLIDDTYNASPDSVLSALQTLLDIDVPRHILVFADILELGTASGAIHSQLGETINTLPLTKVYTFGQDSIQLQQKLNRMPAEHFETAEQLAEVLLTEIQQGDAILFKGSRGMKVESVLYKVLERGTEHGIDLD